MRIRHKTQHVGNPLPCTVWNEDHIVEGAVAGGGDWELIKSRDFPSGSVSHNFTGLNGNNDIEYRILGNIIIEGVEGERAIVLRLNGDAANNYSQWVHWRGNNGGGRINWDTVVNTTSSINIGNTVGVGTGRMVFDARIIAATGTLRQCFSTSHWVHAVHRFCRFDSNGSWNNINANITSLIIMISSQTFRGNIRLYRRRTV